MNHQFHRSAVAALLRSSSSSSLALHLPCHPLRYHSRSTKVAFGGHLNALKRRHLGIQPERKPKPGHMVFACGMGQNAQLGVGDQENHSLPQRVVELPEGAFFMDAAAGSQHTLLLTTMNEVYCWGAMGPAVLQPGRPNNVVFPTYCELTQSLNIVKIRIGRLHGIALSKEGYVFTWGSGEYGQTGVGGTDINFGPIRLETLRDKDIVDIACGLDHCVALSRNGRVWTWGFGIEGQLGHNDTTDEHLPKEITSMREEGITRITCGPDSTVLINEKDGVVFTCGNGEAGQLGHGKRGLCLEPSPLNLENVKDVASGGAHMIALTKDGQVWSWGWGINGRLGHGSEEDFLEPEPIKALSPAANIVGIAAGGGHSLVLDASGRVFSWGYNGAGQLGLKHTEQVLAPSMIDALAHKRTLRVLCGLDHSLFITEPEPEEID